MALYLVQHGKALPKEIDPDPGLSDEGKAEAAGIASVARDYRVPVASIIHSGRKRARETALIFAEHLGPDIPVNETTGMGPADDAALFASRLVLTENTMYVGHLPFMEKLASFLVTGAVDRPVFRFQNAGIVCIDLHTGTKTPVIIWTLLPSIK